MRKVTELLFTTRFLSAHEAGRSGMVNHAVSGDRMRGFILELASHIDVQPVLAAHLAKEAVHRARYQDRLNAKQTSFALHQVCHTHNLVVQRQILDAGFRLGSWKAPELAAKGALATEDSGT